MKVIDDFIVVILDYIARISLNMKKGYGHLIGTAETLRDSVEKLKSWDNKINKNFYKGV